MKRNKNERLPEIGGASTTLFERKMFVCFSLFVFAVPGAAWACFTSASLLQGRIFAPLLWLAPVIVSGAIFITLLRETIQRRESARAAETAQSTIAGLLESLPYAFFALDPAGRITYANGKAEAFLGQPRSALRAMTMEIVLPESLRGVFSAHCARIKEDGETTHFECCEAVSHEWFAVGIAASPQGLSVTMRNITSRKRVEEEQERLLAILEATPDLIAINDIRGNICYFNRAGRRMLGLLPGEENNKADADGMSDRLYRLSAADADRVEEKLFPIGLEHNFWRGETTLQTVTGAEIPISQVVIPHKGPDGKVAYLSTIVRDITDIKFMKQQMQQQLNLIREQKTELEQRQSALLTANKTIHTTCEQLAEANRQLEAQATTDGLTGLKNHRAFQQRLAQEFERCSRYHAPLSVLLLDVDKFKQYNDTYGHPAGDEALKQVARLLETCARATDMAARYGGEEFAVILPNTEEQGAVEAGERIRAAIEQAAWQKRSITISVGAATMRVGLASPSALIEEADKALYISKEFGRNCVTHHDLLLNALVLNAGIESDLTAAEAE